MNGFLKKPLGDREKRQNARISLFGVTKGGHGREKKRWRQSNGVGKFEAMGTSSTLSYFFEIFQ